MSNKPDERLIILLPPDLLEEVRRAAEDADLSVSQLTRRALRNELKAITAQKNRASRDWNTDDFDAQRAADELIRILRRDGIPMKSDGTVVVPGASDKPEGPTNTNKILRTLRGRK